MYLITTSLRIPIKSEVDSLKDRFSSSWYIRQYAQADNGHVYTAGKEREGGEIGPARERQKQGLSSYCREYKTPVPPLLLTLWPCTSHLACFHLFFNRMKISTAL